MHMRYAQPNTMRIPEEIHSVELMVGCAACGNRFAVGNLD